MKILFQGDSITDVGRNTNNGSLNSIGQGYPCLIASRLGADEPETYEFVNRGISGNRIVDVYARIKADCWNLAPDLLSILIGVNDVWHEFGGKNGVDAKRFYNVYKMLVTDTLEKLPGIRMILMEPFVLKASATEGAWDEFRSETEKRAEAVRRRTPRLETGRAVVHLPQVHVRRGAREDRRPRREVHRSLPGTPARRALGRPGVRFRDGRGDTPGNP